MKTVIKRKCLFVLIYFVLIAGQCHSQTTKADSLLDVFANHPEQIMVTAHRAAHQLYPENSLAALNEAIRLGVDIVETDIRQTKDHVLVIMHNDKVDHPTNGKGELTDYTYKQLCELRLLQDGTPTNEKVPTLEQYLMAARGKILVDLDFKLDDDDALERTFEIIEKTNTVNQVLFFLYDYKKMVTVHEINKKIKIMPRAYTPADVEAILNMNIARVIHIDESFYSDSQMRSIRDKHVRIWSNALGKYDDLQSSTNTGFKALLTNTQFVNVIQTNLPAACLKYLKEKGAHK
ncbi:glycerophosphodiester phosphodiesterase family protein [Mucilaginibacter endophyticus]|uniref:glycerophosphodiester phosphodiesterase family protein n=1 Tax=Mucilaginibacter endophyticus TaxID=2675003 RepID=UPI000E0CC77F|nr:glycerophosphodiester phosphodiesterase family protein [Mucilaginibacter endophyticus]